MFGVELRAVKNKQNGILTKMQLAFLFSKLPVGTIKFRS
jgi:hypothetical protein